MFESVMLLSWIVALIGLYLMVRSPRQVAVGMFVLPLVLGLVIAAGWFAPRESAWPEWGGAIAFWGTVHGIFLLAGAVFTCVAFFAGLMYLVQMRRLKAKRPSRFGLALPSLEQSERINRGSITIAFPLLTFGLLIGVILSLAAPGEGNAAGMSAHVLLWTDSKVLSAASDVAGVRGLAARAVSPGDAGEEHDGADDRRLWLFGVHVGWRRGAAAAHGSRHDQDRGEDDNAVRLLALGVDHRSAPVSVREALAFDGAKCAAGLDLLAKTFPGNEFVILSTCNRVELYVAGSPEQAPETNALVDFLIGFHGATPEVFSRHLVSYHDEGVIDHLFKVAASLESLVLGEGQILGQVRQAYQAANERKTVGPIFHPVFQSALRVGKLVREKTGMDQGKLSIASVAVDLAKEVFDSFADKTVLVIGAGKMGEATLQHLKNLNPGQIVIMNRDPDRAVAAASRWNGRAVPFEKLNLALIEADLVISTTAAPDPIVTLEQYVRVQRSTAEPAGLDPGYRHPSRLRPPNRRARPGDALPRRRPASPGRAKPAPAAKRDRPRAGDHRTRDGRLLHIRATFSRCRALASATGQPRRADPPARAGRALRHSAGPRRRRSRQDPSFCHASSKPVPPPPQGRRPLGRDRAARRPRAPPSLPRRRPTPLRPGRATQEDMSRPNGTGWN